VRWYRDPEVARLTRYQTRPMSQAEIERFFQVRMLAHDALAYSIVELPAWRLIGFTTFSALDGDNGSVMFHITIGERDAWGRGLGTEATQLMLGHAFERLGLHRVGLTVFSYNVRAIRAYRTARIDSSAINTHVFRLDQFTEAFEVFRMKKDGAVKVVLEC